MPISGASTPNSRLVDQVHRDLAQHLRPGDIAIDATMGNGHDTLFLARCVGASGLVYAFDVQPEAQAETRKRLLADARLRRVVLVLAGHQALAAHIPVRYHGKVKVVMFNLGFRPGSDKRVTTNATTTIAGLDAAVGVLAANGCISIVAYPGHPGGRKETDAVREWSALLDRSAYRVSVRVADKGNARSPVWLAVQAIAMTPSPG